MLTAEIGISFPFIPPADIKDVSINIQIKKYRAIWDTGATHSVITSSVVEDLGLKPIGMTIVHTANGSAHQNQHMVNLYLPNQVMITMLKVTEAPLHQTDVLIGMDIISKGDFCVTNFQGKTVLTFRMPSCEIFDFVKNIEFSRLPRSERRRIERERGKL